VLLERLQICWFCPENEFLIDRSLNMSNRTLQITHDNIAMREERVDAFTEKGVSPFLANHFPYSSVEQDIASEQDGNGFFFATGVSTISMPLSVAEG